ncbi:glycoside hydrolase family 74 protein [Sodiomyces alcalophilus JCM 7366]|uniref:glycoside hydrolase family 74 protein n=1 Tax=Sodiomyces alcalophilus JCM 7366 TaxID=591952 RepID=UPI0039B6D5DD
MRYHLLLAAAASACAAFSWENVHIGGGGGFVPGILFHPNAEGVAYARTDIGGLYRWNSDDSWTPLTDKLAFHHNWNRWGIDAVAVDPSDPDVVLAAFGMYTNSWDPNNGAIGRSENRGETWSFSELPFKVGGNMPGRGMGERLAVDPINSDIVYFGARSGNGLWKSTDGGATFEQVTAFPNPGTFIPDPSDQGGYNGDIHGLAFVTFDTTSDALDGATSRIFVGTADKTAESVYVSEDAGATWTAVADQPVGFLPHKAKLSHEEGFLYLTYSDGSGPYDGSDGAIYRYSIADGSWTNITPVSGDDHYFGFGGLALDAQNPGTLVVAALNSWWPDAQIWRSTDSGATWSPIWQWGAYPEMNRRYNISAPKAPWIQTNFLDGVTEKLGWMIESLEINPFDSDHWLYGTGLTIYGGHDLANWDIDETINIQSLADGIEEFAVLSLASAPNGSELLAATFDNAGFTFASRDHLDTPPQTVWANPRFDNSVSVDYAGNDVGRVVHVGNVAGGEQLAVSSDGGLTWSMSPAANTQAAGGTVAYSADGDTILWSTETVGVQRSLNGAALSAVASLPSRAVIASDKRENDVFYAGAAGVFYVSTDGGATFVEGGELEGVSQVRSIAAHPTEAGDVWVSTNAGVFHSVDFGQTFQLVSSEVTDTFRVALGRGEDDGWNVYVFGTGAEGPKLYASANGGATWEDIQGEIGFGAIDANALAGSANHPGLVYVGTNGRGVFWAEGVVGAVKC